MKKGLFIFVIICLLLITGCTKKSKNELNDDIYKQRSNLIQSVGKTSDNKIVIKELDTGNYYIFNISGDKANEYAYLFYNNGDDYEVSLNNYSSTLYDTKEYKDIYCLYIKIKTITNNEDKSIKDVILDMYNDTSKYEIIN